MFVPPPKKTSIHICKICNEQKLISASLSICNDCILSFPSKAEKYIYTAHKKARERFNLPVNPPSGDKKICSLCYHNCGFGLNDMSFCGLRYTKNGKYISKTDENNAILDYYFDPLPCNCCAAWFCPAGTGLGYPDYAYKEGKEYGYYNLSIFFYGCSFNCLFCQNKSHKSISIGSRISVSQLTSVFSKNPKIACICFFGGSPEPQFDFAINLSEKILQVAEKEKRIARICWEWNGFGTRSKVRTASELSFKSGGNIKFDLKAWSPSIHKALTGVDNKRVLDNFKFVGETYFEKRSELAMLNASTLLVPGYIDEKEVEKIASFIASINENIPYSLLGFYPHFEMRDLPLTSLKLAEACFEIASDYLTNVNIGNKHILAIYE